MYMCMFKVNSKNKSLTSIIQYNMVCLTQPFRARIRRGDNPSSKTSGFNVLNGTGPTSMYTMKTWPKK
jgi:hypothetical protein